ncbi:hypothetical protein TAMA11512_07890 [Selenomonas sp. TAMA-11512]|uniref:hypothetical protein n=1 Tax=Selenomonas sp. TAMA-11512 TaxID=3095337 RepID=UPI0030911731|nr:hypothetical protein TAMA11512_07890 [Selenomonas sp. TAMA-11512]
MTLEELYTMPAPALKHHPRMERAKRAAQFMPFAALTGYAAELQEESRCTEQFIEQDEYEKEEINRRLAELLEDADGAPCVRIVFFVPDARKEGGAYTAAEGRLKKYRTDERVLVLDDGTEIPTEFICSVELSDRDG